MRKCGNVVAVAVLISLVPAGGAFAAPVVGTPPSPPNAMAVGENFPAALPAPVSIRGSLESLRLPPIAGGPKRLETAVASSYAQSQPSGRHGMGNGTKAVIWAAAVAVAGVWGWKTFSVTRGTD